MYLLLQTIPVQSWSNCTFCLQVTSSRSEHTPVARGANIRDTYNRKHNIHEGVSRSFTFIEGVRCFAKRQGVRCKMKGVSQSDEEKRSFFFTETLCTISSISSRLYIKHFKYSFRQHCPKGIPKVIPVGLTRR